MCRGVDSCPWSARVLPRNNKSFRYRSKIQVDAQDFAVVRKEGRLFRIDGRTTLTIDHRELQKCKSGPDPGASVVRHN